MELILKRKDIKAKIKKYNQKITIKNSNQTTVFIGILDGTLPFTIDLLREHKSILTELDYIFSDDDKFMPLKSDSLSKKNVVILFDRFKNESNSKIKKIINYINGYKPISITLFSILKDKNYQNIFPYDLAYILESDSNKKYCGYGLVDLNNEMTNYLNIYSYE